MKPVIFLGNSLKILRGWEDKVKQQAGTELRRVQHGEQPTDFKPMATIGTGVYEIRIKVNGQYRVIYTAKQQDAIYVLAAFQKKTQKTPAHEIDNAKARLKLLNRR